MRRSTIASLLSTLFIGIITVSCDTEDRAVLDRNRLFDSLSISELELLRGVSIAVRQSAIVYRFDIVRNSVRYTLPEFDINIDSATILDPVRFDVVQFARSNGVDGSDAYAYVEAFSKKVIGVYRQTAAYEILQDSTLGDFIIFDLASQEFDEHRQEVFYRYPGGTIRSEYWREFFRKATQIKKGWFI